jgi:hypothetical protein
MGEVIELEFEVMSPSVEPPVLPGIKVFSDGLWIRWDEWPRYEMSVPDD